jgi:hypothetical protein
LASPPGRVLAALGLCVAIFGVLWQTGIQNRISDRVADVASGNDQLGVTVELPQFGVPGFASDKNLPLSATMGMAQRKMTPAGENVIVLQLYDRRTQAIDIYGMSVDVISRAPLLLNTLTIPYGLGGGMQNVNLVVEMNGSQSDIYPYKASDHLSFINPKSELGYFLTNHINIEPTEKVGVSLFNMAYQYSYTWDLVISYTYNNQEYDAVVSAAGLVHNIRQGHPFTVTALDPHVNDYRHLFAGERLIPPGRYCADAELLQAVGWTC